MSDSLLAKTFTIFAQVMVKIQPVWDKYKLVLALLAGILIGWFAFGWWLFPVEWTNATPGHLREDYRSAYLAYAADEYYKTGRDRVLLQHRLGLDLPKSKHVPWLADAGRLKADLDTAVSKAEQYQLTNYATALSGLQTAVAQDPSLLGAPAETPTEQGTSAEQQPSTTTTGLTPLTKILKAAAIAALVLIAIGGGGILWYFVSHRRSTAAAPSKVKEVATGASGLEYAPTEGEEPVKSFSTPYVFGDDYFDPSFSIEIGTDFLGECGIGISEILGAGDPKKVTAFEAWLFDKGDIRTVTKVLATEYAFNNPDLRAKLDPKGEVVLMQPGSEIILETTGLRVKARIKDLEYAQSANLPPNSFVQKVDFELQAWVKQTDDDVTTAIGDVL